MAVTVLGTSVSHNKKSVFFLTHITQVSPVDVQKISISDIGPILWMSVGEPRNIPTAETEIQGMSFFLNFVRPSQRHRMFCQHPKETYSGHIPEHVEDNV